MVMESWQHVHHWMSEDIEARKVVAADRFFKRQLAAKERFFKRHQDAKIAADRFFKESEENDEKMRQLTDLSWSSEKIFRQLVKHLTDCPNDGKAITATGPEPAVGGSAGPVLGGPEPAIGGSVHPAIGGP